ncbi:hypothetical protein GCM10009539_18720 [Cryptosporangium japonicum]|uniref:Fibronectin type-III domain-containing protein n=1 Tax=Cryptosporangium japonicum TaxID=80872 RepID=A0ABN0TZ37_9ACTN
MVALCLVAVSGLSTARAAAPASTAGSDFWVAFSSNSSTSAVALFLYVTGVEATTGAVTWPDGTSTPFAVTPGTPTRIPVDPTLVASGADATTNVGLHVTAAGPVTVQGLNSTTTSADGFTALPTANLGTRYRAVSYGTVGASCPSRLIVVGTQDGTAVTVTPYGRLGARTAGAPYVVTVNRGEAYTVTAGVGYDVTGSLVTAAAPVAVFAGNDCGVIGSGGGSDQLYEQLPPVSAWGTTFLPVRFAKDSGGDPVRVVADADGTVVRVDGTVVATLAAGQTFEQVLGTAGTTGTVIVTSRPALAAQYVVRGAYTGWGLNGTYGDPAMTLVPPAEQYLAEYAFSVPVYRPDTPQTVFPFNAMNLTVPTGAVGSVRLDGVPVPAGSFAPVGSSGFSSAPVRIGEGPHVVRADARFGLVGYGSHTYVSYAYPGGAGLTPVGTVTSVTPDPATQTAAVGASACVTAAVGAAGVYVGFRVDGANPAEGEVASEADGTARFCATGTVAGVDTVRITAGAANADATIVRAAPVPPGPPAPTATPPVPPGPVPPGPVSPPAPTTDGPVPGEPETTAPTSAAPSTPEPTSPAPPPPAPTSPGVRRPDAPARPRVVAGDQAIAVSWDPPVTHGAPVSGYTATARPGGEACTVAAPATGCVLGNLTNTTAYRVSVTALSSAGASPPSAVSAPAVPADLLGPAARLTGSRRDGVLTLTAVGFRPGGAVAFWLRSTPRLLGTAVADRTGRAALRARLPAGVRGHHVVTAQGSAPSGHPLSRALPLAPGPHLPRTGGDVVRAAVTGLLLVAAGLALRVAVRRRVPRSAGRTGAPGRPR